MQSWDDPTFNVLPIMRPSLVRIQDVLRGLLQVLLGISTLR